MDRDPRKVCCHIKWRWLALLPTPKRASMLSRRREIGSEAMPRFSAPYIGACPVCPVWVGKRRFEFHGIARRRAHFFDVRAGRS